MGLQEKWGVRAGCLFHSSHAHVRTCALSVSFLSVFLCVCLCLSLPSSQGLLAPRPAQLWGPLHRAQGSAAHKSIRGPLSLPWLLVSSLRPGAKEELCVLRQEVR